MKAHTVSVIVAALALAASTASAQPDSRLAVSGAVGAATGSADTWGTRSFTDPAVNLGGGLRFDVTDRLMIRPDARALIVFGDGQTHTLGVFVVHVGYRF
jgi:hypothetical protein